MRIGELASALGCTLTIFASTNEREGLLPAAARKPNGYQTYDESTLYGLRFVQGAQRLGLTAIKELLSVRDTGACACEPATDLLSRRLLEVETEIA